MAGFCLDQDDKSMARVHKKARKEVSFARNQFMNNKFMEQIQLYAWYKPKFYFDMHRLLKTNQSFSQDL